MSHQVSEEQLKSTFHAQVKGYVFDEAVPSDAPVLVLLGAQPAAGKSRAQAVLEQEHPGIVTLTGDELRRFHPDYRELMKRDPLAMPNATAQASGAWVGMSIDHARENGYSLLLEGTFRDPDMTTDTAREFADAGYHVRVVALGVNDKVSRIDSVNRYLTPGPDSNRWTPAAAHDLGYRRAPDTVQACEDSPHVHQITITDRSGQDLFTNHRQDGVWQGPTGARDALLAARDRPWEGQQARSWLARREDYTAAMIERGDLDERTLPTFEELHRDADEVAQQAWPAPEDDRPRRRHRSTQRVHSHILDSAASGTPNNELPTRADLFLAQEPHGSHAQAETERRQGLSEEQQAVEEQVRVQARELAEPRQQRTATPEHDPSPPRGPEPDRDPRRDDPDNGPHSDGPDREP